MPFGNVEDEIVVGPDSISQLPAPTDPSGPLDHVPVTQVEVEPESRLVTITDPRSPGADRLRFLRMRLRELRSRAKLQTVAITSALPEDGKSTVSLSLAVALADSGQGRVLLIEADLHKPTIADTLGVTARKGLAECLEGSLEPVRALQKLDPIGLYLMQAGYVSANPTELLQSPAFGRTLDTLKPLFDWILIDTPPVAPLSDALAIANQVDGTLLVVRADRTPREVVEETIFKLGNKRITAIVFNGAEGLNNLYNKYSSYYGKK